ncbi:hypothetical protein B0H14DRAFT_2714721 [Mycena olivaceomarginata]|nr:hypothetical protein B0H14DRAFT_2714721 [Mycena olivaceomarginata]
MAFFANSTNFKISGGSFNVIHGDSNHETHTYSTLASNSYNDFPDNDYPYSNYPDNFPDENPSYRHYDQYAPPPSRGRRPSHRRSQRRYQEHGPYGYAEYYEDGQSEGHYNGRQAPQGSPSPFETSLRSPSRHVEIAGGEFTHTRTRNATRHYHPDFAENSTPESEDPTPASSETDFHSCGNDMAPVTPDLDPSYDITMPEEEAALQNGPTAVPVASADTPPPKKTPTHLEKMRRAMADMEIDGTPTAAEAVNKSPAPPRTASEGKQKSAQSFTGRMSFPFRPKAKP